MNDVKVYQPLTGYSGFSDNALTDMFRHSVWIGLDEEQRLDLLQEVVNRETVKNGGLYSCKVEFCVLPSNTAGEQRGNTICLNRQMFVENQLTEEYNGRMITYSLPDSNYNAYETVLHEHQHVKQDMIVAGLIPGDEHTKNVYQANSFTTSTVDGKPASQYMFGVTDYSLYYLNPTELDAYKTSQTATRHLVSSQTTQYGADYASARYLSYLSRHGYEAKLKEYRNYYGNEMVDKEVENALLNEFQKSSLPVSPDIERAVKIEMIESQNLIDAYNVQKEIKSMGKQTFTENGFTFVVDDNGTVTASGKVNEDPASRSGMSKINPNGYDSHVHDKGHLIAARQGGPAKAYNVSAQDRGLNRGAYKSVENAEVRLANKGYDVQTSKTAYVSQQGAKPDAYMINDTITTPEGETQHVHESFQNESAATQEAWNNESAEAFSQMADEYDNPGSRPSGMTEAEYAELMDSTDQALDSVKDDYDMDHSSETSFDLSGGEDNGSTSGASSGIASDGGLSGGADGGADGGIDDGCSI